MAEGTLCPMASLFIKYDLLLNHFCITSFPLQTCWWGAPLTLNTFYRRTRKKAIILTFMSIFTGLTSHTLLYFKLAHRVQCVKSCLTITKKLAPNQGHRSRKSHITWCIVCSCYQTNSVLGTQVDSLNTKRKAYLTICKESRANAARSRWTDKCNS